MANRQAEFSQQSFSLTDHNAPEIQKTNTMRAGYHASKDIPAVDLAERGMPFVHLPTPHADGIAMTPHVLHRGPEFHGAVDATARAGYSHAGAGQQVMGLPHEDVNNIREIDHHGNVQDTKGVPSHDYADFGPYMGRTHQHLWDTHGKNTMLPATAALHTSQNDWATGDHSYVSGPLDASEPAAHVLIHKGVPKMLDGHHRTAEWRERGHSEFPARVLNLDQLGKVVRTQFLQAKDERLDMPLNNANRPR